VTRPLSPTEFSVAVLAALRFLEVNELASQGPNGTTHAKETAYPQGYACGLLELDFYCCFYGNDTQAWSQFLLGLKDGGATRQLALKGGQH